MLLMSKTSTDQNEDFLQSRRSVFSQQKIDFTKEVNQQNVQGYILENLKGFEKSQAGLELISEKLSPGGKHFAFRQTIANVPVYNTYVKVNFDNESRIRSTFNNAYDLSEIDINKLLNKLSTFDASGIEDRTKALYPKDVIFYTIETVLLFTDENTAPLPYLSLDYEWASHFAIDRILVNAEGDVMYTFDLKVHNENPLMVEVPATVFLPDPLTTAEVSYGGAYTDQNDAAVSQLDAERDTVMIDVIFDSGVYVLESDYVKLAELEVPTVDILDSSIPSFYYSREDDGFEQVNCYYHLNHFKEYLTSIDFESIHTVPLIVDAHGVDGDDNSYFSSNAGPPRLVFGEGCVDDGEDADVIIHENGHHISWSAAPGSNIGFQRRAMDEGIGDYWAASYSRDLSEYDWWKVFTWDGHNTCWPGRSADADVHYPENISSSIHSTGQIWSTALMNIWEDLGRTVTDRLMMQANFSFAADMIMPEAAALVLQADSILYDGDHSYTIMKHMYEIGLMPLYVFTGNDTQKCPDETRIIGSEQPQYDHVTYLWSPAQGLNSSIDPLAESTISTSTNYTLTATDTLLGNSVSEEVLVFVYFCEVGIDEDIASSMGIRNTYGFTYNGEPAVIFLESNKEAHFQLYDVNGKCVDSKKVHNGDLISGQNLSDGIYFIYLESEKNVYSSKIIKQ